jgi:thymidylate synthase
MMILGDFEGADTAFRGVIGSFKNANHLSGDGPEAKSLRQGSLEHLNFMFGLSNPRKRLSENLRIYPAVARFVWMMSANNRLADIAFHEPKVKDFTDDGLTVPGSSYGMRLRQSQPGLDQIEGAINRLRTETDSRRAAAAIFQPMDAVRDSNDIPCAFGLLFHNRSGRLHTTVMMRSNNSFRLLPFNMFEFSMLAEVVAIEAKLELGPITYFAGSMHLYDSDAQIAQDFLTSDAAVPPVMEAMPSTSSPLSELTKLGQFESELRHGSAGLNRQSVGDWVNRATAEFSPYWAQFALLLVSGLAAKIDNATLAVVTTQVNPVLRPFAPRTSPENKVSAESVGMGPLFDRADVSGKIVSIHRTELAKKFARMAQEHEKEVGLIGAGPLLRAQQIILDRLAARGEADALTLEVFRNALQEAE